MLSETILRFKDFAVKHNRKVVSVIAVILAILMVFGLVVSIIPYVLADEYVPEQSAEAAECVISDRAELSA